MSNLIAIAYEDVATARNVLGELGELGTEHAISLDDAVIIEHRSDGKVKLHQSMKPGAAGAAGGALWGGLIGLLFLAPLLGMAVGAASGGVAGAMSRPGRRRRLHEAAGRGPAARCGRLIVLVRESTPDKVLPRISQYGGSVVHTSLSEEADEQLRHALGEPAG